MQNNSVIGIRRGNMFSVYTYALIVVVASLTILIYFKIISLKELVNPILLTFISVVIGIPYLLAILKFLDKKPMIIIDSEGVSMRKSRLPFSGLELINWNDVKDYSAKVNRFRHGETKFLIIRRKSTDKKYYVDLFDLKTSKTTILAALKKNLQKAQRG